MSKLSIIQDEEDDTVGYINGTCKFNVPIKSPWTGEAWAAKRYGTKWATEAFHRRQKDICDCFTNPLQPAYGLFKDKQQCPFKKGVSGTDQ